MEQETIKTKTDGYFNAYGVFDKATEFCRVLEQPTINPWKAINNSIDYLFEETRETERAFTETEVYIEHRSFNEPFVAEGLDRLIDGFGDVAFVAINGIYKSFIWAGDNHDVARAKTIEVLNRICDANLAKMNPDGTVTYNEQRKVVKPLGWRPPEYLDLLN